MVEDYSVFANHLEFTLTWSVWYLRSEMSMCSWCNPSSWLIYLTSSLLTLRKLENPEICVSHFFKCACVWSGFAPVRGSVCLWAKIRLLSCLCICVFLHVCLCVLLITVFKVSWSQALPSKPDQTTDWQTPTLPHTHVHQQCEYAQMSEKNT